MISGIIIYGIIGHSIQRSFAEGDNTFNQLNSRGVDYVKQRGQNRTIE